MMNTLPSAETPDVAELRRLAEACPKPGSDPHILGPWWDAGDLARIPVDVPADREFIMAASPAAVLALLDDADALRAVRTVGDLTARHQLTRPRIRVDGRVGTLKLIKPSDAHPGTLTLIWGDWWEDVSPEELCEVLPEGETHE